MFLNSSLKMQNSELLQKVLSSKKNPKTHNGKVKCTIFLLTF